MVEINEKVLRGIISEVLDELQLKKIKFLSKKNSQVLQFQMKAF